jgi:hypothetical protein
MSGRLALGLTIDVLNLSAQTWLHGAVIAIVLAVVARPLTVLVTLGRARLSNRERAFVAWSGLKGAVPILLGAFAIIGGVPTTTSRPFVKPRSMADLLALAGAAPASTTPSVGDRAGTGHREDPAEAGFDLADDPYEEGPAPTTSSNSESPRRTGPACEPCREARRASGRRCSVSREAGDVEWVRP